MKIIRLTTSLDFGGQEKKYILFTNNYIALKYEFIFAAIGHGGYAEHNLRAKGFEVKIFNKNPSVKHLENIYILYKWFRQIKPNIVHTAAGEANFHGILAARLAGVKTIIAEEIGFPSHSRIAVKVFTYIYLIADKVICVSQAVKNFLVDIEEIPEDKAFVLYNPVSLALNVKKDPQQYFTIVSVGRLEKVKNFEVLLHALHMINDKTVRLILVGEGSERRNLENMIRELQLYERVLITGFSAEPEKYIAKADLFVLPSISEGFGIAAAEAMQYGVPCLCSEIGGIPEFILDGKTGWLFNPKNESELYKKLEMIITMDRGKRDEIGIAGMRYTGNRFSENKYASNLQNLYKKLSKK